MADKAQLHYIKMTQTPVSRLVTVLAVPTTISMLVTNIYNMVDTYFVGKINNSASGAVGVLFGMMAIIQAVGFMFGQGAGSIIARKLGEKNVAQASETASVSFFYALVAGLLITIFGNIFINPLLRLLGSTETILPYARTYGIFILLSAPLMTTSFVLNNVLRYEGRANLSMIGLIVGAVLNIFGDWLLMSVFDMGIAGAGLSTAISQAISFVVLLSVFIRRKTQSRISFRLINWKPSCVLSIMKTGFPSLTRQALASVSTMILNGQARIYGDAAIAAMSIVNRICFFAFAVGLGIGQGFQPVASFNYGAKKFSRVRSSFKFTFGMQQGILGVLAIVGFLAAPALVAVFRNDPQVIAIGSFALRAQMIALFFQPLSISTNMMLQGVGKNLDATFLSLLRGGLVFIPVIFILSRLMGMNGVAISQALSDVLTFFVTVPFMITFFKKLPQDQPEPAEAI